jgi:hypothetical protein
MGSVTVQVKLAQSATDTRVSAQPSFLAASLFSLQHPRPGSPVASEATGFAEPKPSSTRKGLGTYEETGMISDTRSRRTHQQRPARACKCVTQVSPRL